MALLHKFLKKISTGLELIFLFILNFIFSFRFQAIELFVDGDVAIRGLKIRDFFKFRRFIKSIDYHGLTLGRQLLYLFAGDKFVFIALNSVRGVEQIVGVDLYYLNRRDIAEKTIHEGFIGVSPEARGKGLASSLRMAAIRRFSDGTLKGISSRISLSNSRSLNSAKKLGFSPVERYYDQSAHEERYYLVRSLETLK